MVIKRVGGKAKIVKWIYSLIPNGKTFVDVFGGSGSVLDYVATKRSDLRCVYNDLDSKLYIFFSVLQNKPLDLAHFINLTPYSRKIFDESYSIIKDKDSFEKLSDIDKAIVFLIVNRQSFGSKMESTWSITRDGEINYDTWNSLPSYILKVSKRWKTVFLENLNYKDLLTKWDSEDAIFYLDPPYEGVEDYYYDVNKKTGFDHKEMLDILKNIKGSFCVSYYGGDTQEKDTNLINEYKLSGCKIYRKSVKKHLSTGTKDDAVEVLLVKSNSGFLSKSKTEKSVRQILFDGDSL